LILKERELAILVNFEAPGFGIVLDHAVRF
jgi:hypothetical protein